MQHRSEFQTQWLDYIHVLIEVGGFSHLKNSELAREVFALFYFACAFFCHSAAARQLAPELPATTEAMRQLQAADYAGAVAILKRALREFPRDAELWDLLGIASAELHRSSAAEEAFATGLKLAPGSVALNEDAGLLFFRDAKYPQAKQLLENAIKLGSDKPSVRFSLAASRLRSGEEAAALAELRSLEPALSAVPEYWEERGRAELIHDPASSEASFDRALDLSPKSLAALNGAAAGAEKQGLDEKALAYLIRARAASPNDVPTLLHFAEVCIRRDLGPDAIAALEQAHRLEPSNASVLYLLARANISVQNWQTAYDLFSSFTRSHPNFAPAYYALGWIDIRLNRVEAARKQLEHCLSLAPGMSDARYELAQLIYDDGQLTIAEKMLERVLRENPHHAKANMTMGDIAVHRGDLAGAQKYLETAVRDDPSLAAAHYKLGVLYSRVHQPDKGEQEKKTAAALTEEANHASKTQLRLVLPEHANVP